jgi:hypothetical protein
MASKAELESYLASLNEVESSIKDWLEPRTNTLAWKLREGLAEQSRIAAETRDSSIQRLKKIELPNPERIKEMRKQFTSTIRNVFIAEVAALAVFFILRSYIPAVALWLLSSSIGVARVLLWAINFFIVTYISALLLYYRSWSKYYRDVRSANTAVVTYVSELAHLQDEEQRLSSVHAQANSWYQLLSMVLLKPWEVASKWLDDPSQKLRIDQIPLAVRFGRAHAGSRATTTALERKTLEALMQLGWRAEALDALIEESALDLGLDVHGFDIRTLDSDLPEASNGSRKTLLGQLQKNISEKAGDRKVRELAKNVREEIIPSLATPVKSLHPDSLQDLDWTYGGADDDSWSGFYSEIFGKAHLTPPAFSSLPLTPKGLVNSIHESFESYAIVPSKTVIEEADLTIQSIDEDSPRWIDLSVRIDVTGPHEAINFRIIRSDGDVVPEEVFKSGVDLTPIAPVNHPDSNLTFESPTEGSFN